MLILLSFLFIISSGFTGGVPLNETGISAISSSMQHFTGQILGEVSRTTSNVVFSPFSLHNVLSMLHLGSAGQTKAELEKVLNISDSDSLLMEYQELMTSYANLIVQLGVNITLANGIFADNNFSIRKSYLDRVREHFFAEVQNLNFSHRRRTAIAINQWVEEKTLGTIRHFIPVSAIRSNTKSVVVNAIYFKAAWLEPFQTEQTYVNSFYSLKEDSWVSVDFMKTRQILPTKYDTDLGCRIISLPYLDENFNMIIFLPDNSTSLNNLVTNFQSLELNHLQEELFVNHSVPVFLDLPKFSVSYKASLANILSTLGVEALFQPELADLSNISDDALFVGEFLHEAKIVVNEEGSEATAVSGAALDFRTVADPQRILVNTPFLFVIHDSLRNIPLFVGIINDPRDSEIISIRSTDGPEINQSINQKVLGVFSRYPTPTAPLGVCTPGCLNKGVCAEDKCICSDGFEGDRCEKEVRPCEKEDSPFGGILFPCTSEDGKF